MKSGVSVGGMPALPANVPANTPGLVASAVLPEINTSASAVAANPPHIPTLRIADLRSTPRLRQLPAAPRQDVPVPPGRQCGNSAPLGPYHPEHGVGRPDRRAARA